MRPAPCGYSSARIFEPILFFLPQKEKKEGIQNRKRIPCRHHVTTHGIGLICPPQITPNCDPAQRSQFGKEEGASEYGAFAAPAEAECSWLLLTPRRFFSFSIKEKEKNGGVKKGGQSRPPLQT